MTEFTFDNETSCAGIKFQLIADNGNETAAEDDSARDATYCQIAKASDADAYAREKR